MGRTTLPLSLSTERSPDVLDIVVVKDFVIPVHLTVCRALSSDHLPVLMDITCRTSFRNLLDRPDIKRMDWVAYQAGLEGRLPGDPTVIDEEAIDKCAIQEALASSAPRRPLLADSQPSLPTANQDEIRLKNRLKRRCMLRGTPL
jgi:hypothetical protein